MRLHKEIRQDNLEARAVRYKSSKLYEIGQKISLQCGRLIAGVAFSNPAESMEFHLLCLSCAVQVAASVTADRTFK